MSNPVPILLAIIFLCVAGASVAVIIYLHSRKPAAECDPDTCKAPRGSCSSDNKCVCSVGWSGEDCSVPSTKCDPSKCKNGECVNGICQCMDGYGGMNCETECADTELSIKCADGLQYKCCDKSITVCDTTGACCPTGLNRELKCNSGYTCDDKTSSGLCTTTDDTKCPPQWCPSQTFLLCDDILEKNKMYIIINEGVITGLQGVKAWEGGLNRKIVGAWGVGTLGAVPSPGGKDAPQGTNMLLPMPQYLDLSSRKKAAPKDPSESYLYVDDSRPDCECITGKDDTVCQRAKDESDNELPLQCASKLNLWSLQKFKYKQFYPNKPNSLLYQIATGFIKNYQCQMSKLDGFQSYCLGMGPRNTDFPSTEKLGSFFRFVDLTKPKDDPKANHLLFPELPSTSDYGDWRSGVPWVELENPSCGGLCAEGAQCPDKVKSKIRQKNTLDSGCVLSDKEVCAAPHNRKNGFYMFVRVADPKTGKFYRFYLGTPPNYVGGEPVFTDEFNNPLGASWDIDSGATDPAGIRPEALFFFTEDVPYGLEKYISIKNASANTPYGGVPAAHTAAIDLFVWQFSEILPLPPQDSWQTNTLDSMPYCHLPACELDSTFWLDTDNRCHNMATELPPNLPWGSGPGQIPKPTGADTPQGVSQSGNTYYSTCGTTGHLPSDPKVCDLSQLPKTALVGLKTDCNTQARDFCESGIKYVSAQRCGAFKAPEPTGVPFSSLYMTDGGKCVQNTIPSPSPSQVFPTEVCSPDYRCDKFGNLNSFGG